MMRFSAGAVCDNATGTLSPSWPAIQFAGPMNNITAKILLIISGMVIVYAAGFLVKWNQHKRSPAPQKGPFTIMQGNMDGHPLFASIDMGLRNSPERQALLISSASQLR